MPLDSMQRLLRTAAPLLLVGAGFGFLAHRAAETVGAPQVAAEAPQPDVVAAAEAYLKLLSEEERAKATVPFDDARRVEWHFLPDPRGKGIPLRQMNLSQQKAARELLRAAMSQVGYDKAAGVMTLELVLHDFERGKTWVGVGLRPVRDPERYYFTLFGKPSTKGTWGLSVEGHHLSLNFVFRDGKGFAHTPAFLAALPAEVKADFPSGPKKGDRVLRAEEDLAFALVQSFTAAQRSIAVIAPQAPSDIRGPVGLKAPKRERQGLAVPAFQPHQQAILAQLIRVYLGNMPRDTAEREWNRIAAAGWENVYFAWAGALDPGIGHYYRVEGPTFLLEFVNVQPDFEGNPANHVHSVWRDSEGDFGFRVDDPHE